MKLTPWLVVLSLCLVACSGSKSAQKVDEDSPQIELSDADEFIENPAEEPVVTDTEVTTTEPTDTVEDPILTTEGEAPVVIDETPATAISTTPVAVDPGTMLSYTVQKNETLMMIAFKLYGDYEKWKVLAAHNQNKLKNGNQVIAGSTIQYPAPAETFVWNPQGLPYLIRTGDTLMGISGNVYNTVKKWKLIWENNRPLIKNPDKIFAGFTIYYLENGREVASEI